MALGYAPALLLHMADIANGNYSGTKQNTNGFLNMLASQPDTPELMNPFINGHTVTATAKYRRRATEAQVSTTATCGPDMVSPYAETAVTIGNFVQLAVHIPDSLIRLYPLEASQSVAVGKPATRMMQEHYDVILSTMSALKSKMETVLTTKMALNWGQNRKTGLKTARTVNFNLNGTVNNYNEGLGAVIGDYQLNEQCGNPLIVGNGVFNLMNNQRMANAIGLNQSGIDNSKLADMLGYRYFDSPKTQTTWGLNQFGVFSPGSVHLLQNIMNTSDWVMGGDSPIKKFTIIDPTVSCWTPTGVRPLEWDVKLIYNPCAETISGGYLGSVTVQEGWNLIIYKSYDLFYQPNDMYDGADPLAGNNGTLLFAGTNA